MSVALDTQLKTSQPKTTIMSAYLFFNQEQHVLICKEHQYAITSKLLSRHFLEEHKLDFIVRQEITKYASQFTTADASELIYSTEKVVPVPYLSICTGFQCQYNECNKILGTLQSAQKHCQLEHDWKAKDGEKWIETRAQTFFQGNNKR
jgi:Orsellinic acid/F9775 biosynthesis cluster protein D